MEVTSMPEYQRIEELFKSGKITFGKRYGIPIYTYEPKRCEIAQNTYLDDDICGMEEVHDYIEEVEGITPGHYIGDLSYCRIKFSEVPKSFRTREFYLNALSLSEVADYVKDNLTPEFDKQFFKDYIATDGYALNFERNCFSYMPTEFIDYEMLCCAMRRASNNDFGEWFYSILKRKPEIVTEDIWILAARLYGDATSRLYPNTPEEYRTARYYYALCDGSRERTMNLVPKEYLTNEFLLSLFNENPENLRCFTEEALEREIEIDGKLLKLWQHVVKCDGTTIDKISLNQERVDFFFKYYDKDSSEYKFWMKDHYKKWIKSQSAEKTPKNSDNQDTTSVGLILSATMLSGIDSGIELGNALNGVGSANKSQLPICFKNVIPVEFRKIYDSEEYLLEVYKRLGIQVIGEAGVYFYNVIIPDDISIQGEHGFYDLVRGGKKLLSYLNTGLWYDRSVYVSEIYVTLTQSGYKF